MVPNVRFTKNALPIERFTRYKANCLADHTAAIWIFKLAVVLWVCNGVALSPFALLLVGDALLNTVGDRTYEVCAEYNSQAK